MISQRLCPIRTAFAFFVLLVGVTFASVIALGQSQSVLHTLAPRTVDETSLVTLWGNTHPLAQDRFDRGAAATDLQAGRLMLLLRRSPAQESSLQSFLQAVQVPGSSAYRKFLTPEEFGERFGLSDADLGTVQAWLQQNGFVINKINKGRTAIEFSGNVGQLQQAFHTTIHRYLAGGVEHLANATDPQIPAALSPLIAGVANLNDFKPRAHLIKGPAGKWIPASHRFSPELTGASGSSEYLFVSPGDAATIYNAPNSLNTRLSSSQTQYDGTGVTIGVIGDSWVNFDDVTNYRTLFGIPLNTLSNQYSIVFDGNENNLNQDQDQTEALLDSEVAGALAPGADIILYAAGDTTFQPGIFLAIDRALDDNKVNILSLSYGECEASLGAAGNLEILNAWEQAAAQGITVTVSSGDSGSAGCDDMNTETVATQGLAVNGLASTPYNIAVGGTDFDVLGNNFSKYVSSTNSSNYTSALSYIPEEPWNNSTVANGLLAANSVYRNSSGETGIVAGGGGASSLGNGGASGYAKPFWQQQYPLSNTDSVRDLPDVSLLAANGQYGVLWAICGENECPGSNGTISGVGGTSAAAPAFAGILAMINQKVGASTRLGQANWVLYQLAQTHPSAFHSIVTGNNSVYCTAGTADCGSNSFLTGYNAGSGYNLATGLGSVDISSLINNWSESSLTATSTTLSLDKTTFTHGTPVNIGVGVNPSAATGAVAIEDNYASQTLATTSAAPTRLTLSDGSATVSFGQLPGGTYNVYASYAGDSKYQGSVSQPVPVTVSPENSTLQLSVDAVGSNSQLTNVAGTTVPLGTVFQLSAQVIGNSQLGNSNLVTNATGFISIADELAPSPGQTTLDATGNAVIVNSWEPAGQHSIIAYYNGDLSYNSSSSSTVNFTVAQAPTTISLTSSVSSIAMNSDLTLTAQIAANIPINLYQPNGSVTFTDTTNNSVLGTAVSSSQCSGVKTLCYSFPIGVGVSQLTLGTNNIVASYSGDNNFLASGPSSAVTVTCTSNCPSAAGQSIGLSFGQMNPSTGLGSAGGSLSFVVDISSTTGFTGAVNMTCSVTGKKSGDQYLPTCSFNPAQVNITNSNGASTTLTIKTTAPTTSMFRYPKGIAWHAADGTALATLLLLGIPARRIRRHFLLGVLTLCLVITWITACGGGGSNASNSSTGSGSSSSTGSGSSSGASGTTADLYTVTFKAVDAATGTVTAEDYSTFSVN